MICRLSQLLFLLFLFTSYILALPIADSSALGLHEHSDGSHNYEEPPRKVPNLSDQDLKKNTEDAYLQSLKASKKAKFEKHPGAASALYTKQGDLILSSTVNGGGSHTSVYTEGVARTGKDGGPGGRCSEMGGVACSLDNGLSEQDLDGARVATHGKTGGTGHGDKAPFKGCEPDLKHYGIRSITKRDE